MATPAPLLPRSRFSILVEVVGSSSKKDTKRGVERRVTLGEKLDSVFWSAWNSARQTLQTAESADILDMGNL